MSNSLVSGGVMFGGDNCICFWAACLGATDLFALRATALFLGAVDVATMHAFLH